MWSVPRSWTGETCFIVGGGTSVETQDLALLRRRRVILINSSYERLETVRKTSPPYIPNAGYLIFSDANWWREHQHALREFPIPIIAVCEGASDPLFLRLHRCRTGWSEDRSSVMWRRTTMTAAVNVAGHLGCSRIVTLGLDGKRADDGRTHHHNPHPQDFREGNWGEQRKDFELLAQELRAREIELINASPGSALSDIWPTMTLAEAVAHIDQKAAA